MRKNVQIIAMTLLLAACSSVEVDLPTLSPSGESEGGYVQLEMSVDDIVMVETETRSSESGNGYLIDEDLLPTDFKLTISGTYYDQENEEDDELKEYYEEFDSIADYNEATFNEQGEPAPPYLAAGDYTVAYSDGRDLEEESATNPCYNGSEDFTVVERKSETLTIDAKLQNAIIQVSTTPAFKEYYVGGGEFTISTEDGAKIEYSIAADGTVESGGVLFCKADTKLYLEGSAVKQATTEDTDSTTTATFDKIEIGQTTQGKMTSIEIDSDGTGSASIIKITLNGDIKEVVSSTIDIVNDEE